MTTIQQKQLFDEIDILPIDLKTKLVDKFLNSINQTNDSMNGLWIKEINKRRIEIEKGNISLVNGEEVFEKINLIKNAATCIIDSSVKNIRGKGNHYYQQKPISHELVAKINKIENLQHQNTYRAHLKKVFGNETKTHDLRYTYAKKLFHKKIADSIPYRQVLKEVSEEINHHRETMTIYYLKRA